ncbi:MAG TPA: YbjQ family protein [Candidatus Hydrogenedentes bacterium]|nr:YbjQ family protein [Candidatus Hydrogenedentota bacterium]HIJ74053.1 YbjQ family protein [Candidatus Hydrogenedentota bacterium]
MIIVTSGNVHGKRIAATLGLVRGSTVRSRHVGKDILAFLRNLVGGEVEEYTKMLAEAREQAIDRMIYDAKRLGANAITDLRFGTSSIAQGAAEILAYGTAVVLENDIEAPSEPEQTAP